MATEDDLKNDDAGYPPPHPTEDEAERAAELIAPKDGVVAVVHDESPSGEGEDDEPIGAPNQLGYKRYVYAAYFAAAIGLAFMASKIADVAWLRLSNWKPAIGEPQGEIIIPLAGLFGAGVAYYYWRDQRTRTLAEEVASELSKVTWPTKDEVMNSTTVVIFTTVFATIFFALMDRFWGFLTNLVYGT